MATVPTPTTWVPGLVTSTMMNAGIRDPAAFILSNKPLYLTVQSVAQTLTSSFWFPITFHTEVIDRDAGHSTVTNVSRYTGKTAGWYMVTITVAVAISSDNLVCCIAKNGSRLAGSCSTAVGTAGPGVSAATSSFPVFLNGTTDYVEAQGFKSQAGSHDTALGDINSSMSVEWISN